MKKISVIIPNYNNEKFVQKCLTSVINQDYLNKEIIIIDDGSTDNSVKIIRKIINKNKSVDIRLICQDNLNAAIARNEGMKIATGDYALFLDSDDVLEKNILSKLMEIQRGNQVDLIIGSYKEINESGKNIGKKTFTKSVNLLDPRNSFAKLLGINPVPSNKLYDLKIIRKNDLIWGNVKIGQDLNFYVKYLSLCKKVLIVPQDFYKYRIIDGSISRTFDFRIFDIVDTFKDIERFYYKNGFGELYKRFIPPLALEHFNIQMAKQIFYDNHKMRKMIINYFVINEKELDYTLCKEEKCGHGFKLTRLKVHLKGMFSSFFASGLYRRYKLMRAKK